MSVKDNMKVDDVFTYLGKTAYEISQRPAQAAPVPAARPLGTSEVSTAGSAAAAPAKADTVSLGDLPSDAPMGKSGCC